MQLATSKVLTVNQVRCVDAQWSRSVRRMRVASVAEVRAESAHELAAAPAFALKREQPRAAICGAQVVDILLAWAHSRDWAAALSSAVPTRKRAAGEAGEAAAREPAAAAKAIDASTEPAAAAKEPAAAGEPDEAATTQPANAAAAESTAADGEPAQAANQPSSSAAGAAFAVRESANDEPEGRGDADVAKRQPAAAGVGADAQQDDTSATEPSTVEGEQPSALVTAVSEPAVATTPHSAADDKRHGDDSVHAAKRQKTAAEN